MSKSRKSDWTAVFFLFFLVGAMLIAFTPSSVKARPDGSFLATTLLVVPRLGRRRQMAQWLIADLSVSDVHYQFWMLLVAGVILFWFLYVWATR